MAPAPDMNGQPAGFAPVRIRKISADGIPAGANTIAYPPGHRLGIISNPMAMAWRPHSNLIDGELDNRTPGKVTGWLRFCRRGDEPLTVRLELDGDFHEDIRGGVLKLTNPRPFDYHEELEREGTYVEGFCPLQRGTAGDITAGFSLGPWSEELAQKLKARLELIWQENGLRGRELRKRRQEIDAEYAANIREGKLYYPYVPYPYIEWYADNGRVVLELDPSQVEFVPGENQPIEKTASELAADEKKRARALGDYMMGMVRTVAEENRQGGGDDNVIGLVIG